MGPGFALRSSRSQISRGLRPPTAPNRSAVGSSAAWRDQPSAHPRSLVAHAVREAKAFAWFARLCTPSSTSRPLPRAGTPPPLAAESGWIRRPPTRERRRRPAWVGQRSKLNQVDARPTQVTGGCSSPRTRQIYSPVTGTCWYEPYGYARSR